MRTKVNLEGIYVLSEDVVAREIQGEFIIIPITSGIGDSDDEIFSLNKSGKAIWDKLDSKIRLRDIVSALALEFEGSATEIKNDVLGLTEELLKRKIIVKLSRSIK